MIITSEVLALEFNKILGNKYKILPYHTFSAGYTKPMDTPYGTDYTIDYQAFDEYGDIIPGTVNTAELSLSALPYMIKSCSYTAMFWVPVDVNRIDENGQLIEAPKFNFFADYKALYAAIDNIELQIYGGILPESAHANLAAFPATGLTTKVYKAIDTGFYYLWSSSYVRTGYRAFLTMSEPVLISTATENSGAFKRLAYKITGNFSIMDWDINTGKDIKVSLSFKGSGGTYTEYFFENITEFGLGENSDANAIQLSDILGTQQEVSANGQQFHFYIDDRGSGTLITLIRDKTFKHIETLNTYETDKDKIRKVLTKVYKGGTLMNTFWGILSQEYTVPGTTSIGRYHIGIVNDEKGV